MIGPVVKQFQLWVWYSDQPDPDNHRGWELHSSYNDDEMADLFIAQVTLDKEGDMTLITKGIELKLEVSQ